MKMYLSSYELGNETGKLRNMVPGNNKVGYIFNALDFTGADPERKQKRVERNMNELNILGFDCFELDLRKYFGKPDALGELVNTLGAIWVSGGNVFVLRQAFKLSGFDEILLNLNKRDDFLYGAYSAGVCVLSPTLDGYHVVDDATDTPFEGLDEVLWDGLGIIDYTFLPHFESDHPESESVNTVLEYCKEKGLQYKTLRDGEVIIIE
ncbi:MAG: Type 1 glutamine amidotransferase-like domain-containing protein [Candidatus Pacebacteria bacterium]|nr:Type 1 glutamine amidotransferase-like domain-containing protein [Candidatus Paceibacterota bacterium]